MTGNLGCERNIKDEGETIFGKTETFTSSETNSIRVTCTVVDHQTVSGPCLQKIINIGKYRLLLHNTGFIQ